MLIKKDKKLQKIPHPGGEHGFRNDPMMRPYTIANTGSSTVYFKSYVGIAHPDIGAIEPTEQRIIEVKASHIVILPHRYYTVNTRDGKPARLRPVTGDHSA